MTRNLWKVLLAASGLACFFAFSASAETVPFTTEDGVLSMELSDESWKDVDDQDTWVTLTNGSDVITLFHIRNGEKLPDPAVADDPYSDVYQAWLSSKDEVFVLTGSVRNSSDLDQVEAAIESAEILKKGTKKAVSQNQTGFAASSAPSASSEADTSAGSHAGSGAITEIDVTYYVKSSALNVRASDDSSAAVIGQLSYGDAVKITGYTDNHWYRISYRGGDWFCVCGLCDGNEARHHPGNSCAFQPCARFQFSHRS